MSLGTDYKNMLYKERALAENRSSFENYVAVVEGSFSNLFSYSNLSPLYTDCVRNTKNVEVYNDIEQLLKEAVTLIRPEKWQVADLSFHASHICTSDFESKWLYIQNKNRVVWPAQYVQLRDTMGTPWMCKIDVWSSGEYSVFSKFKRLREFKEQMNRRFEIIKKSTGVSQKYVSVAIGKERRAFVLFEDGNAYDSHTSIKLGGYNWNYDTVAYKTIWAALDEKGRKEFVLDFLNTINNH